MTDPTSSKVSTPIRSAGLRPSGVEATGRDDGTILLHWPPGVCALAAGPAAADAPVTRQVPNVVDWLAVWASERPQAVFMAERAADGQWQRLNYRDAWQQVQRISHELLHRQSALGADQLTIAILTGNSMRQALLTFAALYAGIAVAPISPGYAAAGESARLRAVMDIAAPHLVYCEAMAPFSATLDALGVPAAARIEASDLDRWAAAECLVDTNSLEVAHTRAVGGRLAKIMFTSGSTGIPKGVAMSHAMLASAQATSAANLLDAPPEPPTYLEWLPWHHVMGGNVNLHRLLRFGGSAWLDAGKPVPGRFGQTIENLREIAPSFYFNVPLGYAMLVPALARDEALARNFFSRLEYLSYGGAQLGPDLTGRIDQLAVRYTGWRVPIVSAYGATETCGPGLSTGPGMTGPGALGLPAPGVSAKLVSAGDRFELRLAGGNVGARYLGLPAQSQAAVDEEGYYRTGDAVRWIDPSDPRRGLAFAGRISEDFKLSSGTWVNVGALRLRLVDAMTPFVTDAVITGHDRDTVAAMVFLNDLECRKAFPDAGELTQAELARHLPLVREIARRLDLCNAGQAGSSHRIARVLLLAEAPSADAFEITDKGYVNQRAVLERRIAEVQRLYSPEPADDVAVGS